MTHTYTTRAGATVIVTPATGTRCQAVCGGCGATDWNEHWNHPVNDESDARAWAQLHADDCRTPNRA